MKLKRLDAAVIFVILFSTAIGAYLVYLRGWPALLLLGLGAFFVLFYTWPLKYIGLGEVAVLLVCCLLYTSPSPRDRTRSRMPSSA